MEKYVTHGEIVYIYQYKPS